jgi:hypothetical protein
MVPYIDGWQDGSLGHVASAPPKKSCKVIVARAAAASKNREKCKNPEKLILEEDPKEPLPPQPLCATVQIREFLGASGFCWIWIPNYSLRKTPL